MKPTILIRHLSVTVKNPQRAAAVLAEMTDARAERFRSGTMTDAWVCMWGGDTDELIEFIPEGFLIRPSELGAQFDRIPTPIGYNSTHVQLETGLSLSQIRKTADKYDCKQFFRPNRGGPLYEVWIEEQFLVEFTSDEIRALALI